MSLDLLMHRSNEVIARVRAALGQGGPTGRHYLYIFESVVDEPDEFCIRTTEEGFKSVQVLMRQAAENGAPAVLVVADMWAASNTHVEPNVSLEHVPGRHSSLVSFLHLPDGTTYLREQIYAEENGRKVFIDRDWNLSDGVLRGLFSNPWAHTDTHTSS